MTQNVPELAASAEPFPNLPLLRKVLDHIDAYPEKWNQAAWGWEDDCGTAMCVAGWANVLDGGEPYEGEDGARNRLGITADEAHDLFIGTLCPNDYGLRSDDRRGAVQLVSARIAARAGEVL